MSGIKLMYLSVACMLLIILFIPTGVAFADVGPKTTLEFHFSNLDDQGINIVSANFLACKDVQCLDTQQLEGYQMAGLTCKEDICTGRLYFYSVHLRLNVVFSDNRARISNPITVPAMRNVYSVRVGEADLVVTRNAYLSNNAVWGLFLVAIPFTAVVLLLFGVVLVASNVSLERRNLGAQLPFRAASSRYIRAWVLAALALLGGALLTWALPLTIVIELGVAYLFVRYLWPARLKLSRHHVDDTDAQMPIPDNRPPMLPLATAVVTINLITQPVLWVMAVSTIDIKSSGLSWPILLMEAGVWLVESLLLWLTQWRHLKWLDAFQLSFLMNLASFVIGLLVSL
jgi:hypothetical protein